MGGYVSPLSMCIRRRIRTSLLRHPVTITRITARLRSRGCAQRIEDGRIINPSGRYDQGSVTGFSGGDRLEVTTAAIPPGETPKEEATVSVNAVCRVACTRLSCGGSRPILLNVRVSCGEGTGNG